jgi:hypothetical protein
VVARHPIAGYISTNTVSYHNQWIHPDFRK